MSERKARDGWRRKREQEAVEAVVRSAGSVALHEMREEPDGDLIHDGGFHIGVEVVQTVDQSVLDAKTRMDDTIASIRVELERRGIRGQIQVYFDVQEIASTSRPERRVPEQLAAFLERHPAGNFDLAQLKAGGVQCVGRVESGAATTTEVYLGWQLRSLNDSLVGLCLQKKHERLPHYRTKNGDQFREYWLAIASLGPGTIEDGGYTMLLDRDFVTDFDRVFLIIHDSNGAFVDAKDVTPPRSAP